MSVRSRLEKRRKAENERTQKMYHVARNPEEAGDNFISDKM